MFELETNCHAIMEMTELPKKTDIFNWFRYQKILFNDTISLTKRIF